MYKIKIADNLLQETETEFYCSFQQLPAILDDTVIHESTIRSTNIDIILPADSSEFNQINFVIQTRSPQIFLDQEC
uniref:Putative ovule protein n=1 Tax=Solanum chacoense TaxID=4108 RepID=A0A0V0H2W4_SOLCH